MSTTFPMTSAEPRTGALILAAGLGSRLGSNTVHSPKCLVPVAGAAILQRMLDNLIARGVNRVTIAVGYLANEIRRFIRTRYPYLSVHYVENPEFMDSGSVYSLHLALQGFSPTDDLVLIEGDVVLEPALMTRLLDAGRSAVQAATLLAPYEPCLSGTFAQIDDGRVTAWLHESVRRSDFPVQDAFKTVNVTYVRQGEPLRQLKEAVERVIAINGKKAPLEFAMQELVAAGMRIEAVETAQLPWFEVDTPEDLAIANAMFAPQTAGV
ncbi:phosphocholine cytidylyltransferase family protein [Paludibacterium paludis]|uniref:MobA-like NTP transferase domain-containing protein n=1 Tax=Paludibacterium paludis TaxID=1225769 RepID=A0A918P2M9_9NEIS|nr:phosphocholine cytidylyltransferase family protein [Paludibacterium paludis]GGY14888.1 hypothetical protein GCM10011289_17800 [Paludibacterium paludis]